MGDWTTKSPLFSFFSIHRFIQPGVRTKRPTTLMMVYIIAHTFYYYFCYSYSYSWLPREIWFIISKTFLFPAVERISLLSSKNPFLSAFHGGKQFFPRSKIGKQNLLNSRRRRRGGGGGKLHLTLNSSYFDAFNFFLSWGFCLKFLFFYPKSFFPLIQNLLIPRLHHWFVRAYNNVCFHSWV